MELTLRAMLPEETKYTFRQSTQLQGQTGSIGHLRGDFDRNGTGFFTTWNDHFQELKTDEFKAEINDAIHALRFDPQYDGVLKDRDTMAKRCYSQSACPIEDSSYGLRADTPNHTYMMRLDPSQGAYNFYVFCYKREWLDMHIAQAQQGIRFIDTEYNELFHLADGESVTITAGYDGEKINRTCRFIDPTHVEVGDNLYHIHEFAYRMKQAGNTVVPKENPDRKPSVTSQLAKQQAETVPKTKPPKKDKEAR